jgi:hypothetical protein
LSCWKISWLEGDQALAQFGDGLDVGFHLHAATITPADARLPRKHQQVEVYTISSGMTCHVGFQHHDMTNHIRRHVSHNEQKEQVKSMADSAQGCYAVWG